MTNKIKKSFDIAKNIFPTKVPARRHFFPKLNITLISFSRLSVKKQSFFVKRLSFLTRSGMPILESMNILRDQSKSQSEIKILDKIIASISSGQSLSGSLERLSGTFGSFAINVIRAGESSGMLTENLNYLSEELKKKENLRRKILGSLAYPFIIAVATFGITGFLILYIFPKIAPVFKSLRADLPLTTKIVMTVAETIKNDGFYIAIGIFVFFSTLFFSVKYFHKVRLVWDGFILRLPIFGILVRSYNLSNITRTLGILLRGGLSLTESLTIAAETIKNSRYKKCLESAALYVTEGRSISQLFEKYPTLFPGMLSNMLAVGERSGNLANTLTYLSEYYENEFDDVTKNLSSSIEPILMIIMGLLVGFVAVSVITPIYEITNNIKR